MHDQGLAGIQIRHEILRPPSQRVDPCAGETLAHARRERPTQVRTTYIGRDDAPPDHHRIEPAPNGFYFRKFGQNCSPGPGVVVTPSGRLISKGWTELKGSRTDK